MRRLLFVFSVTIMACAAPHVRADSLQADPQLLTTCIANAAGDRAAMDACRGVVARSCIEAEGVGTHSEVLCWSAESDAWEAVMAGAVALVEANPDPEEGARLRLANEAWRRFAEAECEYRAYEYGGGSGEQVDRVLCWADVTASRAIDLIAPR